VVEKKFLMTAIFNTVEITNSFREKIKKALINRTILWKGPHFMIVAPSQREGACSPLLMMTRSSSSSSTEDEKETRSTSCEFGRVACYLLGTGGVVIKSSDNRMNGAYLLFENEDLVVIK